MVKLESLKKSFQFKKTLKEKKVHSDYFSIFATKNFYKPKVKTSLLISFVMKKKIGNAVKRNKIRRKLKAIVQKLLKKRGAINKDYTYIVFGKSNAYAQKHDLLLPIMEKCFGKIKNKMIKIIINFQIYLIKIYKYLLSPLMGSNCRYDQECSEYFIGSLKKHGLLSGSLLGVKRILTCHPVKILGGGSSYNYVPSKEVIKKEKFNG